MPDEQYKSLRGIENTQDATLSNQLLENFITFMTGVLQTLALSTI